MIDRRQLLTDLKKLVAKLEDDLRERCDANAHVDAKVRAEYEKAREGKRTALAYSAWREEWLTQVAVAWVLSVVFVRFIEDNELVPAPWIAGPGSRLQFARERRTAFFQEHPTLTDREYLEHVFRQVEQLPAMKELFDERHNPVWALGVSGDGAKAILAQFQAIDPASGALVHDFTDPSWETRFLGDLYQDLSESARKKYALLQTPEFVEEFILDRTLDPAIEKFGLDTVRMIDPTCGSGHFLLGGFARLFRLWQEREPATNPTVLAQRALDGVYGVDLNPYAVAISRFRLLLAAMKASGVKKLSDAPAFRMRLAVGDSLLHGPRFAATAGVQGHFDPERDLVRTLYGTENADELRDVLGQQYHAVVGNPPYIAVTDPALRNAYRQKYGSCSGRWVLSVPFMERFFELPFARTDEQAAGFVGQITASNFMKREFGAKLIESYIPNWDLTHMVDTSGAYIPGHGTSTVILFGRNQTPASEHVRAIMGIRGEPSTPEDPARGLVWSAITAQIDHPGSASQWVSVTDAPRAAYHKHPWSIGGGGAAELKELLEERAPKRLSDLAQRIGITSVTGEDDLYMLGEETANRLRLERSCRLVSGDLIRDWSIASPDTAIWIYDENLDVEDLGALPNTFRLMWPYRTSISRRRRFGTPMLERGLTWYEWQELYTDKLKTPLTIAYAEVATHNHFVLDRGGKVFNRTAPVIKLPPHATEDDHLALLGLLNSSTACFWLRQVCFPKGGDQVGNAGARVRKTLWEERFAFNATNLEVFPLPSEGPLFLARQLDVLGTEMAVAAAANGTPFADELAARKASWHTARTTAIALQEELDWDVYFRYGITEERLVSTDPVPRIDVGQRAFEILLARDVERGLARTAWFDRHGSTPITGIPGTWSAQYCELVNKRIHEIEKNPDLRLIEAPEYKRRWNQDSWESIALHMLKDWLLSRLEQSTYWQGQVLSEARLAATAGADAEFMSVAETYRATRDFDVVATIRELVAKEAVPVLPIDRYKEAGLRNRARWEETWDLQRREDHSENVGEIPVPPKYKSSDFKSSVYWSLRGKLDVAKERFISFPGCERESDPSLPILWAGYDHLQQARAIAAYYQNLKENEAAPREKLAKLLACILELLPWLKQWHNDVDPEFNLRMGDFYEAFLQGEVGALGITMEDLRRIRGL